MMEEDRLADRPHAAGSAGPVRRVAILASQTTSPATSALAAPVTADAAILEGASPQIQLPDTRGP